MGDLPGLRVAVKKAQYSVLQNVVSPTGVSLKISRLGVVSDHAEQNIGSFLCFKI